MNRFLAALSVAFTALGALSATAATIVTSNSGLSSPETTIGFEEVALADNTNVTNQFASFGVTFTPGVSYDNVVSSRPNFSGPAVLDFFGTNISIMFGANVSEMAAPMTANFGSMTVTALLNGLAVKSFSHTFPINTVSTNPNNFFGFTGILFDEVQIDPAGNTTVAIDNLSFTTVPAVPAPASLPLLLAGLGALGLWSRRRQISAD